MSAVLGITWLSLIGCGEPVWPVPEPSHELVEVPHGQWRNLDEFRWPTQDPDERAVLWVDVTKSAIELRIGSVSKRIEAPIPPSQIRGSLITPLYNATLEQVESGTKDREHWALITVAPDVGYATLRRVTFTLGQAQVGNFFFVLDHGGTHHREAGGPPEIFGLQSQLPTIWSPPGPDSLCSPEILMHVAAEGISLRHKPTVYSVTLYEPCLWGQCESDWQPVTRELDEALRALRTQLGPQALTGYVDGCIVTNDGDIGWRTLATALSATQAELDGAPLCERMSLVGSVRAPVKPKRPPRPDGSVGPARAVLASTVSDPQLQRDLARRTPALRYCYDIALRTDPTLTGELGFEMVLGYGRVLEARVTSDTIGNPDLARCARWEVKAWPFNRNAEGLVQWSAHFTTTPTP